MSNEVFHCYHGNISLHQLVLLKPRLCVQGPERSLLFLRLDAKSDCKFIERGEYSRGEPECENKLHGDSVHAWNFSYSWGEKNAKKLEAVSQTDS